MSAINAVATLAVFCSARLPCRPFRFPWQHCQAILAGPQLCADSQCFASVLADMSGENKADLNFLSCGCCSAGHTAVLWLMQKGINDLQEPQSIPPTCWEENGTETSFLWGKKKLNLLCPGLLQAPALTALSREEEELLSPGTSLLTKDGLKLCTAPATGSFFWGSLPNFSTCKRCKTGMQIWLP